jgi:hypothetical protein
MRQFQSWDHESRQASPVSAAGVLQKIGIAQGFFEQTAFRKPGSGGTGTVKTSKPGSVSI